MSPVGTITRPDRTNLKGVSTQPETFPRRCPNVERTDTGIGTTDEYRCRTLTRLYNNNVHGCCGTLNFRPCTSPLRVCVQCLLEAPADEPRLVGDASSGLCNAHAEAQRRARDRRRGAKKSREEKNEARRKRRGHKIERVIELLDEPPHWKSFVDRYRMGRETKILPDLRATCEIIREMNGAGLVYPAIGLRFGVKGSYAEVWASLRGRLEFEEIVWKALLAMDPPIGADQAMSIMRLRNTSDQLREIERLAQSPQRQALARVRNT